MVQKLKMILVALAIPIVVFGFSPMDHRIKFTSLINEEEDFTSKIYDVDFYEADNVNCTKPGPVCGSCQTVYFCIEVDGGFIAEKLDDCPLGSSCLQSTGTCITDLNPNCDPQEVPYNFTCHQVGTFPDPFDCQTYYMCIPKENSTDVQTKPLVRKCNSGFSYDAKTTLCRNKSTNNTCAALVSPCNFTGEDGVIASNHALYYICLRTEGSSMYSPQMFACLDNKVYDVKSKACVERYPTSGTDSEGMCIAEGNFIDFSNPFFYFECPGAGVSPVKRSCDNEMRFEYLSQKCIGITWSDWPDY